MEKLVVHNISELVTLAPLAREKRVTGIMASDLGSQKNAWIVLDKGKIADTGQGPLPQKYSSYKKHDAHQGTVLPGLVDPHTHPIFGGSRADEFWMKLEGKTYQEIAKAGGGILSTVRATRETSDTDLAELTKGNFRRFLLHGVTTVEAKTGYGLSVMDEYRLLKILDKVKKEVPQEISITCLALHAKPREFDSYLGWANEVTEKLLPRVASEKLANAVDMFIETGYFSVADCEKYVEKAKKLDLEVRVHADQFSDANGALAAAHWQAASADHLEFTPEGAIKEMAKKNVTAIILPGTSLYSRIRYVEARRFLDLNCPLAISTDFNPGSCVFDNLPFVATLAGLNCGLKPWEIVAAVTYVAAFSLRLNTRKGALAPGFDGDFAIYPLTSLAEWLADIGRTRPREVWIKGQRLI